jgi:hypothetical protein
MKETTGSHLEEIFTEFFKSEAASADNLMAAARPAIREMMENRAMIKPF